MNRDQLPPEIERALTALEARAAKQAQRLDADRLASRVLARLRSEPALEASLFSRIAAAPAGLRVAAGAVLVVTAGLVVTLGLLRRDGPPPVTLPVAVQGIEGLGEAAAQELLRAVDQIRPVNGMAPAASTLSLEDLSEAELRVLLNAVESLGGAL